MTSSPLTILHQDEALLIIEKPAGMPSCILRKSQEERPTVEGWLQKNFPNARLVHRLDNDTSGLLVAAKSDAIWHQLRALWKTPKVVKKYMALVLGRTAPSGVIDTPIAHHKRKKKKMMVGGEKARPAHTTFKTLQYFNNYSLIEVQITTGVRHQIRIHMASVGHPIAGDRLYQKTKHKMQDTLAKPRHCLHLCKIEFPHPLTGQPFRCKSKPTHESFTVEDSDHHPDLL